MEIIQYEIKDNILTVGFKELDNNNKSFVVYTQLPDAQNINKEELLQQAYIKCKSSIDYERGLEKHSLLTNDIGEVFIPEVPKAVKMKVDFKNLTGQVLDQYGEIFSTDVQFSIENTDKAEILDNKIVEYNVSVNTNYFILAKYAQLEERQQNIIYVTQIINEKIDEEKVATAEAIVDVNMQIENLKEEINRMKEGK